MAPYLGIRYQIRYHRCNLDCPYCIISWRKQVSLFDASNFTRIIAKIQQLPYQISLRIGIGGEFFTSRKLMESVSSICNSDSNILNVSFSTNLAANWERIIQPFLNRTNTLKLGLGCTLHDMVIPDIDVFFTKIEKIKRTGAEVYVGYVAVPGRLHLIAEYKNRCAELQVPLIINGLVGNLKGIPGADSSLIYPKDYTLDELRQLKDLWDTPHSYQLLLESCRTKGMLCSAGRNYIYIDHQGNVSPCQMIPRRMGNILTNPIVFQSEDTICPEDVCWCGNENQALRIVDQHYDRSATLRIFHPKKDIPYEQLYQGYNSSVFTRCK